MSKYRTQWILTFCRVADAVENAYRDPTFDHLTFDLLEEDFQNLHYASPEGDGTLRAHHPRTDEQYKITLDWFNKV